MSPSQQRFEEKFGKAGPERNSDSIGRKAGCDDCVQNIELREEHFSFLSEEIERAREEERERIKKEVQAWPIQTEEISGRAFLYKDHVLALLTDLQVNKERDV